MQSRWVFLALLLAPTDPYGHYPERLRRILDSRPEKTSEVEWTATWIGGRDAGLVERYVTRKASDAIWESNLGDEHGYHPTSYGEPHPGAWGKDAPEIPNREESPMAYEQWLRKHEIPKEETAGTPNSLIYDGQAWHLQYAERPLTGIVQPLETARDYLPVDLPSMGLAPCWWGSGV